MFCECCAKLHRYKVHLISYGCISFFLIASGLIFTIFSVFQKDTQIGKVWLAGPTTMVVGLVLCGKVVIDWGPAMNQQWDPRSEYEQVPGTNAPTSNNSNLNSVLGKSATLMDPDNVLVNARSYADCGVSNDSQDTLEHKGSSNTTYLQASSSSVSSPPTGPVLSYYRVTSKYQPSELRLSMEKNCRKPTTIQQSRTKNISTVDSNDYLNDNVCICNFSPVDFTLSNKISHEQLPLTTVTVSPSSSSSSTLTNYAENHINSAFQGETFVLNNHSYLI